MSGYIEIIGARENNLKNVSLRIPKHKITIFTGVSGSGKSSIVFDTVAAEGQRLLHENFSAFIRTFLPKVKQPEADSISNLNMPVIVDQRKLGGGSSSTVGTVTDIAPLVRRLFSRIGQPNVPHVYMFSFNNAAGMCPECKGLGSNMGLDIEAALDLSLSLNEGAIKMSDYKVDSWYWKQVMEAGSFDGDKKLRDYTDAEMNELLYGEPRKVKLAGMNMTYEGIARRFATKYISRDLSSMSERTQKAVKPFMSMAPCTLCHGARLSQEALASKIDGQNIADMSALQIDELVKVLKDIKDPTIKNIIDMICVRLEHLIEIGLGYLSLDRPTDTLSGGESQRVKIVKYLNGTLSDVMYIFDEPSVGLHPRDVHRLNELLKKLRDNGNTVIVVEHDPDVIKVADHVIDVGPGAGSNGGEIMFEGTYEALLKSDTLTGKALGTHAKLKESVRKPSGELHIENAHANNLQNVSVAIPTGVLTAITGVAGSGKSSLINQTFVRQYSDAIVIDQSPVAANSRSNVLTYTGVMDEIRKSFAKENGVDASLFSFNSKGACENCQGTGYVAIEAAYVEEAKMICEICEGKRYKEEVLQYQWHGKNIVEVLDLTIADAVVFFDNPAVSKQLQALFDVGLEYLTLGQPLSTLSGGECQRVKLASELHKAGSIYVLDEPTTGLHMSDISRLLDILNRLVDSGNTVVAIEHNLDVIRQADWIIDVGPEAGRDGGHIVFAGEPVALKDAKESITKTFI
ncbi:MAG TPA: excinuclease ABC subunit UvrA [Candidatus Saccharimonadales bacterium]